jgi:acyl-[acyl-carrier-protein] desaturase
MAVVVDMVPEVAQQLPQLRPVEDGWQPSDFLPNMGTEGWHESVQALRAEAAHLSDEVLVVLVGNIVTEEALPSYQTALNRFPGLTDLTGTDTNPWAQWSRGWTAEEKRHGDVSRGYLMLSGRVNLRSVEVTIQHLLRNGFDTRAEGDPYRGLAYASFQEHATKTSWNQLGKLCGAQGAPLLHKICGVIAADEARHERVYVSLLREVLQRDPSGGLEALEATLTHAIVMPARLMHDGHDRRLFERFADVGQRIGIYGPHDYAENLAQLIKTLGIETLQGLDERGEQAREVICGLPARFHAMADARTQRAPRPVPFTWIHGRRA